MLPVVTRVKIIKLCNDSDAAQLISFEIRADKTMYLKSNLGSSV